jgi:hypothetical protein
MRCNVLLSVTIDPDHLATMARHRRTTEAALLQQLAGLLEIRAADSVRYCEGVLPPVSVRTTVEGAGELVSTKR